MNRKLWIVAVVAVVALATSCKPDSGMHRIDLSGTWQYALDREDKGVAEAWFDRQLTDSLLLPGSLTTNGIGDEVGLNTPWVGQIVDSSYYKSPDYARFREPGNIKIPFWLQPVKYYKGAAWYQKDVTIPESWAGQTVELYLERCHWESRVWVDSREAGMQNSLGTAHRYTLSALLTPGKHRITVCIDNRIKNVDPGINSHSVSDHTQSNWNGIVGQMYLQARPLVQLKNIRVFPDVEGKQALVEVTVENAGGKAADCSLSVVATNSGKQSREKQTFTAAAGTSTVKLTIGLSENLKLWSEFSPEIYTLAARLSDTGAGSVDVLETTFGMREFRVEDKHIRVNGNPVFLRGTLECAIFPKTGYPPTDTAEWLRIFRICRSFGLNHMRFHSWCPPEAAFEAADQTGFYLQVECSSWANTSTTIGDGKPIDAYLYDESQRMVDAYGNHPSFCMMAYGNEPAGNNQREYLSKFVAFWKQKDNRRIYTSAGGWPDIPEADYVNSPDPRIQGWGQGLNSIINGQAPRSDYDWSTPISAFDKPVVSHEIGQWCVYPNFNEIAKYDGVLKAKNFEIFRQTLGEHGMAQLADSFLLASGKLQTLCYKADIEAALRTKDFGGFQLLDLHDFPGQGTALVGVLDPFWDEKGYVTAAEYSRFCNSTVPLARLSKHIFKNNETLSVPIEVAHFGPAPLTQVTPTWSVCTVAGDTLFGGSLPATNIEQGNGIGLGTITVSLNPVQQAQRLILQVKVDRFANSWDIFVYPAVHEKIAGDDAIRVVRKLDQQTLKFLEGGGNVLLTLPKGSLRDELGGSIKIGFSSIFWNTAWTSRQPPHTLGVLVNPEHPALSEFPTQYHSNWQWRDAMSHSGAIDLSSFPTGIKPIVRVIDDWFTNRPLALLFEVKVGQGKLMVSGIDFTQDLENRPEAQQLLFSLKKYMCSDAFRPKMAMEPRQIRSTFN